MDNSNLSDQSAHARTAKMLQAWEAMNSLMGDHLRNMNSTYPTASDPTATDDQSQQPLDYLQPKDFKSFGDTPMIHSAADPSVGSNLNKFDQYANSLPGLSPMIGSDSKSPDTSFSAPLAGGGMSFDPTTGTDVAAKKDDAGGFWAPDGNYINAGGAVGIKADQAAQGGFEDAIGDHQTHDNDPADANR